MTTAPKLGYLVPQFPGQTHIFFWREIKELEKRGTEVALLSTRLPPKGIVSHDWSSQAMAKTTYLARLDLGSAVKGLTGIPWREIRAEKDQAASTRDIAIAGMAARNLIRHCAAEGIEHIHVHSCGRAALIAGVARVMGGPTYSVTLHGPLEDYGPSQRFKWRHASFATIITQKLINEMQAHMPKDLPDLIMLQPMGVDTDHFRRPKPYVPVKPGETLRLFSCARLNIVKGHQDLMEAVRMLLDQGLDVQLEIAGEDDDGGNGYRQVLEGKIAELGLPNNVRLLGAIDAATVKQKLIDAHMFVLASFAEPLGVAYMEAMSCETPTIGTDAGGVPELIKNGTHGLLVPPREPAVLADVIKTLVGRPTQAKEMAAAGRARIVGSFHAGLGAEALLRGLAQVGSSSGNSSD